MNWRALVAGGVFVALLIAAVLIARPKDVEIVDTPPVVREPPPQTDAPILPLTRADLIDAAGRAADAHARGVAITPQDSALVGRRFTLRLPFGCTGSSAADSDAPLRWTYDPAEQTLRVWVTPNVWTDAAPVRAAAEGIDFEAAEGFWIERPWLRSGDCPTLPKDDVEPNPVAEEPALDGNAVSTAEDSGAATATPVDTDETAPVVPRRTLALVELFEPGSRRAARRNGRPYTIVTNLAPDAIVLSKGLRVVVTGRLSQMRQGAPIVCTGTLIDERPLCMIGAEIDRVAITDSSGRRILGEWGS